MLAKINRCYIMNYLFCCILILFHFISTAQVVYTLHPSVGDTIDSLEKLDYSLFPITEINGFNFATILYLNSTFTLIENRSVKQTNGLLKEVNDSIILSQEQIINEEVKIEKINTYFYNLIDEGKKRNKSDTLIEIKLPIRFAGPKAERLMLRRARLCRFDENNLNNEFETGLRPGKDQLEIKP